MRRQIRRGYLTTTFFYLGNCAIVSKPSVLHGLQAVESTFDHAHPVATNLVAPAYNTSTIEASRGSASDFHYSQQLLCGPYKQLDFNRDDRFDGSAKDTYTVLATNDDGSNSLSFSTAWSAELFEEIGTATYPLSLSPYDDSFAAWLDAEALLQWQQPWAEKLSFTSPVSFDSFMAADNNLKAVQSTLLRGRADTVYGAHINCSEAVAAKIHTCTMPGCSKAYTAKRSMQRHIRTCHSGSSNFFCPHHDCDFHVRGFRRADYLRKHLRRKH